MREKSVQTKGLCHMERSLLVWAQSTCVGIHFTPETYLMSFQTPPHPSHSLISLGATGKKHTRNFILQTQPSNLQVITELFYYLLTSSHLFLISPTLSAKSSLLCTPGPLDQMPSEREVAIEVENKEAVFYTQWGASAGYGTVGGLVPTRCPL